MIGKEVSAIVEKRRQPNIRAVTENFIHTIITNSNDFQGSDLGGKKVILQITELCNESSQTESPEAYGKITKIQD